MCNGGLGVFYRDCFEKEDFVKCLVCERRRIWYRLLMCKFKSIVVFFKEYIIIFFIFGNFGIFDFLFDIGCSIILVSFQVVYNKLGILFGLGIMLWGFGGMGDGGFVMCKIFFFVMNIGGKFCKLVEV